MILPNHARRLDEFRVYDVVAADHFDGGVAVFLDLDDLKYHAGHADTGTGRTAGALGFCGKALRAHFHTIIEFDCLHVIAPASG